MKIGEFNKNSIKLINFIDLSLEEKNMVLAWRNSPEIRKWMYSQDEISLNHHLDFIESLKINEDKLYFLVKKEEEFIGVIDFTGLKTKDVYFGFYGKPNAFLGVGRVLEQISIDFAFNVLKIDKLKLEVFEDNIQVRNLHKKYSFKEIGERVVNKKRVICMELKDENR
ncbi:UDP-4-amino-4,6-dideoxy-N-acetyl-beta-L-altrosamine N-acetyltransferase [Arcobacter porcinus]|uniref:UDP-4-amino-4, 6-dideoxy-N-acetyl-beta-L-altrosamine N-acetyltransferase n=1 Tax=Arcobacter porcinus TaxID=1935204 RepID=UPI00082839A7|nr:UDP-4-amino-4,6-dideoxy-N-acetyl-beta-L-altrosamine N-acetyltransferase [Arcobacter porcinus]OCL83071.1 UDP-4-amino-4,6-dideoxy-N-acetyl-beta-L-altrosamine N-acetyltransferase [Arcobacter porcinus]